MNLELWNSSSLGFPSQALFSGQIGLKVTPEMRLLQVEKLSLGKKLRNTTEFHL